MTAPQARDDFNNLRCPHAGCRSVIRAMTGLQEVQRLARHWARKHYQFIGLNGALTIRAAFESELDADHSGLHDGEQTP